MALGLPRGGRFRVWVDWWAELQDGSRRLVAQTVEYMRETADSSRSGNDGMQRLGTARIHRGLQRQAPRTFGPPATGSTQGGAIMRNSTCRKVPVKTGSIYPEPYASDDEAMSYCICIYFFCISGDGNSLASRSEETEIG